MVNQDKSTVDPIEVYEGILEHPETDTQAVAVGLDKTVKFIGHIVMWTNVFLIGAIVAQVLFRYLLNQNYPKLDELQWHFYGLVTMVGISYALVTNSHVRVDLLHMQLSRRAQRRSAMVATAMPVRTAGTSSTGLSATNRNSVGSISGAARKSRPASAPRVSWR